jgi:hypothetical protein
MAEIPRPDSERPPDFKAQGEQIGVGLTDPAVMTRFGKGLLSGLQEFAAWILEFLLKSAGKIAVYLATTIARGEDRADPVFRQLTDAAIQDLTGAPPGSGHGAVGRQLLDAMTGGSAAGAGGNLQPGTAGAEAYMEMVMKLALEGYLEGSLFHALSLGYLEKFGELDDILANVLGVGRATRAVMRPILNARVITPTTWHVNKTYRPELLSAGDTARQVARGRWTREQGLEELARQGFSTDRIEAIFNAQRKFFSAGDVRRFVARDYWTNDQGIQHLKDQGYEHQAALDALRIEGLKRIEQLEDAQAAAILSSYAGWEINHGQLQSLLGAAISTPAERNLLALLAETRRELGRPRLSLGQVEAMVKSGVLSVIDYRNRARDYGYPEDDVMALELQLRWEMDRTRKAEELRAAAVAERALEEQDRAAAAAARKLEIEAERARRARGPLAKLERAAIRGLIPIDRYAEVLQPDYDAETVGILVDLVEGDRQAYLEQQARAAEAAQRAGQRGLNIGELRAAVFEHLIPVAEFRGRLESLGLSGGDADLLAATIAAQLADRDAAEALRAAAAGAATKRSIDLGRFEQLVRKGARTVTQYAALLAELGFDEPDQVAMVELLQLKIAEDTAARDARARAAATLTSRGLSLEQFERAVVLGVKSLDEYAAFLLTQGFTADAQIALVALLRDRKQEADAARARRDATPPSSGARELSIATVRRAARLGVISPDVYAERLARDGYSLEDIELDLELLLFEIADVQARRQARGDDDAGAAPRLLTLAQEERAVRRGLASIDDYRARAAELGYAGDELELLVALLVDELEERQAALERRAAVAAELEARQLSLGQLEEAVTKGFKSLQEFVDEIVGLGYAPEDAQLLAALLAVDLDAAAATATEPAA